MSSGDHTRDMRAGEITPDHRPALLVAEVLRVAWQTTAGLMPLVVIEDPGMDVPAILYVRRIGGE